MRVHKRARAHWQPRDAFACSPPAGEPAVTTTGRASTAPTLGQPVVWHRRVKPTRSALSRSRTRAATRTFRDESFAASLMTSYLRISSSADSSRSGKSFLSASSSSWRNLRDVVLQWHRRARAGYTIVWVSSGTTALISQGARLQRTLRSSSASVSCATTGGGCSSARTPRRQPPWRPCSGSSG